MQISYLAADIFAYGKWNPGFPSPTPNKGCVSLTSSKAVRLTTIMVGPAIQPMIGIGVMTAPTIATVFCSRFFSSRLFRALLRVDSAADRSLLASFTSFSVSLTLSLMVLTLKTIFFIYSNCTFICRVDSSVEKRPTNLCQWPWVSC